jgi:hypothetical protein
MELRALAGDARFGMSLPEIDVIGIELSGHGARIGPGVAGSHRSKTSAWGHG